MWAVLVAAVLIASVSLTRITLELHWVTDVLAGVLLGLIGVTLGAKVTEWLDRQEGATFGRLEWPPR